MCLLIVALVVSQLVPGSTWEWVNTGAWRAWLSPWLASSQRRVRTEDSDDLELAGISAELLGSAVQGDHDQRLTLPVLLESPTVQVCPVSDPRGCLLSSAPSKGPATARDAWGVEHQSRERLGFCSGYGGASRSE